jgi:hypothetical protein
VHLGWVILGDDSGTGWTWRLQPQRSVRTVLVVVLHVDTQGPIQVALPNDEQPVQTLGTNCPDPALGVGVRVRRLYRRQHDVGALRAEHVAAIVWGTLVAPKARWPVPIPTRVVIELVLFGAAAGALAVAGQPVLAVVLGVAALATSLLNASQERQAVDRPPDP